MLPNFLIYFILYLKKNRYHKVNEVKRIRILMKKLLVLAILFLSMLNAEDLDFLLEKYTKENDLSNKTKKESAGNVIVYTTEDLKKMKISSLSELLKNIPYYKYNENPMGFSDIPYSGKMLSISNNIRLYINKKEVSTPFFGSALPIVSKLDIDFIDHVEIYYGVTSFEFGIEPAQIIVKAYTKDPERENGGYLKIVGSSHNSKEGSISYAKVFDDFSLYAYANRKIFNEKKIYINDTELSRDKKSTHISIALQNEHNRIEYDKIDMDADLFVHGENPSPRRNKGYTNYDILGWYSNWFDERLFISVDYTHLDSGLDKEDDENILDEFPVGNTTLPKNIQNSIYLNNHEYTLSAMIKYKDKIKNHNLLLGTYFRRNSFENKDLQVEINKTIIPTIHNFELPYEEENISSFFIEDAYEINDNQTLLASFKYNTYSKIKKEDTFFSRFGYINKSEDFTFKTFYSNYELNFDPYVYFFSKDYKKNKKIKKEKVQNVTMEFTWNRKNREYNLNLFFTEEKNALNYYYNNSKEPYYVKGASFSTSYEIDLLNKIGTNLFIANKDLQEHNEQDTYYGANIRLLNSIGKFDLYNELIYRGGYTNLDDGYNFNSAITYKHTKDFSIFVKGENIFNKAIKSIYYSLSPKKDQVGPVSMTTRRFSLGLEYKF